MTKQEPGVSVSLSPMWSGIVSTVLGALALAIIFGAVTLRDTVLENSGAITSARARQIVAADEREAMRDRLRLLEQDMAVVKDRGRAAIWYDDTLADEPVLQMVINRGISGHPPPVPQPPPRAYPVYGVLPKHVQLVTLPGSPRA